MLLSAFYLERAGSRGSIGGLNIFRIERGSAAIMLRAYFGDQAEKKGGEDDARGIWNSDRISIWEERFTGELGSFIADGLCCRGAFIHDLC
jgi:hypothetical protein